MSIIDHKGHLVGFLRQATEFYTKDLRVLTPEQYSTSHGGCARTPREFTAEVAGINGFMAKRIYDENAVRGDDAARAAMLQRVETVDAGIEAIREAGEALATAIENADDATLGAAMTAPWGAPTTVYAMCHLCASHVMYHDAQLNYVQGLGGDDQTHWFE